MSEFPPLGNAQTVYRTVTKPKYIGDDGCPLAAAFWPRENELTGISVDYNVEPIPGVCGAHLNGHKAILKLCVGRIRSLGLDVVPDEPTHAEIKGLPLYTDLDHRADLEDLTAGLALQARFAWRKNAQPRPEDLAFTCP